MRFKEFLLLENWNKAKKLINVRTPLFHASPVVVSILRDNQIKSSVAGATSKFGGKQSGISTTRDLNFLTKNWEYGSAIMVIDYDKVKTKYKVKPISYQGGLYGDEKEERIETEKLPLKFVKGIIVRDEGSKVFYKDWASWNEKFNLGFDVIVKDGNKYFYAKDKI